MLSMPLTQNGDLTRVLRAIQFAAIAHGEVGQLRDYTGEPYVVHPIDVVLLLATVTDDPELLEAGACHDVDEDTKRRVLDAGISPGAVALVAEVTNPHKAEGMSRAEHKDLCKEHVAVASPRAQTLKCADIATNIGTGESSLARCDPKRAAGYLVEKRDQLQVLVAADPRMHELAFSRINEGFAVLEELGIKPKSRSGLKP